jgi:hypothetical protein
MVTKTLNRRKAITTLFGLTLFAALAIGSGPQVITVTQILNQVSTVIKLLELVDQASGLTLASVDNAYQDLGTYLRDNNFKTDVVISMEAQYAELNGRFSELKSKLNKAESEASNLFKLLRSKADENTNPEFKKTMISRISEKEDSFNIKIDDANQVLSKIGLSIQQYKDILGFAQVTVALKTVDVYIGQVNSVLAESDSLSTDIKQAIEEASAIIESSVAIPDHSPTSAPSPHESISTNWRFPKSACGDDNPSGIQTFYPVFVSPSDQDTLNYIKKSYCEDAFVRTIKALNGNFIQVGSFQTKEKALQFSSILLSDPKIDKAEVGTPSQK